MKGLQERKEKGGKKFGVRSPKEKVNARAQIGVVRSSLEIGRSGSKLKMKSDMKSESWSAPSQKGRKGA
jgi:hypothetical protein